MKGAKIVALNISWGISVLLSSCDLESTAVSEDSASQGAASEQTTRAPALDLPLAGDSISYDGSNFDSENNTAVVENEDGGFEEVQTTAGDSVIARLAGIRFQDNGQTAEVNGRFWQYEKTGPYRFEISRQGAGTPQQQFTRVIDTLLGGNSRLATEFRALILRDEPEFSEAEVERLKAILNPSGAELEGDTVNNLFVLGQILFTHEVTSTLADQRLGTMGGVYRTDVIADRLGFRPPTDSELGLYRFLSPYSQIPYITGQAPEVFSNSGTWIFKLINAGGAAANEDTGENAGP